MMELRPRKGRPAPSTPSLPKRSPRQAGKSKSTRKPATTPSSPILIHSDDETPNVVPSPGDLLGSTIENSIPVSTPEGSDVDEADLASILASSMKAYLNSCEPSVLSKPVAKTELIVRPGVESLSSKDEMKASCINDKIGRTAGCSTSWSPNVELPALKKSHVENQLGSLQAKLVNVWKRDNKLQGGFCVPPIDPVQLNKLARKHKKDTTGEKWYSMSAPTITPGLKKELQLVKLRGVLDPKRHYKSDDSKGLPKYFQVGTVVGGPADYFSGRMTKKERKPSIANELLSDSSLSAYRKRKYLEIQDKKQAGGKGFMKQKKKNRTPAWANF